MRDTERFSTAFTRTWRSRSLLIAAELYCFSGRALAPIRGKVKEAFDAVEMFDTPASPPTPIRRSKVLTQPCSSPLIRSLRPRWPARGAGMAPRRPLGRAIKSARPAVSGDGSFALFVDAVNDLCGVDTDDPNTVEV